MNSVMFQNFKRHAGGEGLKGRSTHYCAGCGHGLVHKFVADAVKDLGLEDRTVLISPVGCTVIMYYYFNLGNTQAAHGRAPAVAMGHKLAHPSSVVISYQGDGDIAAIGLTEIITTAQMGFPISVIFVNNAIYGMTGGQLAPTSLPGQKTSTTPGGRPPHLGAPLKMSELIAQLDGPVYVERVALYNNQQRNRAKRAIHKGLQLQRDGGGFSFVEILAECPTQWNLSPRESERWVKDKMEPYFPLGVKKDIPTPAPYPFGVPKFDPETLLDALGASAPEGDRSTGIFPSHLAEREIALKFAGSGGDGAQTAAMLVAKAAIREGWDATHLPCYGPESRGGTSYADVRFAEERVISPAVPRPDLLVAFNRPSLVKFAPQVAPGGCVLYDLELANGIEKTRSDIRWIGVPLSTIASRIGRPMVKNIVALGALQAATRFLPEEALVSAVRAALKGKPDLQALNEQAFREGVNSTTKSNS